MNIKTEQPIIEAILTTDDLKILLETIALEKNKLYVKHPVPLQNDPITQIVTARLLGKTQKEKAVILSKLSEQIKQVKIVHITLAFHPSQETVALLADQIKQKAGKNAVINLFVDPSIQAGLCISYNGRYKDYSLKTSVLNLLARKENSYYERI